MFSEIKSELDLEKRFPNQQACIEFLEKKRWGGRVVSPFDPSSKVYRMKNGRYQCKNTKKYFNVLTNTVYHGTKLPLYIWFRAIWKILQNKKGISSYQIANDLEITQNTAWYLMQKIRIELDIQDSTPMRRKVQADEALFGGKNGNRHKDKKRKRNRQGVYEDKVYVFGMVDDRGLLKCFIVPNREEQTLKRVLYKNVVAGTQVITDGHKAYSNIGERFQHHTVKDGRRTREDYRNPDIHTNKIENAWCNMKRGYNGIYNWWSPRHFQKYLNEFCFRYNTKKMRQGERFDFYFAKFSPAISRKEMTHEKAT